MPLEKYITIYSNKKKQFQIVILQLINNLKPNIFYFSKNIQIKIDIEISKVELKKKCYLLGKHISEKNIQEQIIDYTYDEKFKSLMNEIKVIYDYIKKLKNDKKNI